MREALSDIPGKSNLEYLVDLFEGIGVSLVGVIDISCLFFAKSSISPLNATDEL